MSETTWWDIPVKAGDNWAVEIELSDANGDPYDLTDIVPRMQVRVSAWANQKARKTVMTVVMAAISTELTMELLSAGVEK